MPDARPVEPPRVRLAVGGPFDARLSVAPAGAGLSRAGGHVTLDGPVSTARVSPESDLRRQAHVMSPDRAHRLWRLAGLHLPRRLPRRRVATRAPTAAAERAQSRPGERLRLRHVRRRTGAERSDRHRRMDARMPGDRCRRLYPVGYSKPTEGPVFDTMKWGKANGSPFPTRTTCSPDTSRSPCAVTSRRFLDEVDLVDQVFLKFSD